MVVVAVVVVVEAASLVLGSERALRSSTELWRGCRAPWHLRRTNLRQQSNVSKVLRVQWLTSREVSAPDVDRRDFVDMQPVCECAQIGLRPEKTLPRITTRMAVVVGPCGVQLVC